MMERLQDLVLSVVSSNPLLERLAAASIDLMVVTLLVAAIVAVARIRSRRVIALLWLVALTKPIVSLAVGAPAPLIPIATRPAATGVVAEMPAAVHNVDVTVTRQDGNIILREETREVAPLSGTTTPAGGGVERAGAPPGTAVAAVWGLGVFVMLLVSVADRLRLRRVIAASAPAHDAVTQIYRRVAGSFRSGRKPALRVTARLESPALAGTFRPVILLPHWMTTPEHAERLEWALRHELTHWSSRDHLSSLVSEIARMLFFFHPLVWWSSRRWREAMEMACDESVVTSKRDVKRYAEQLYHILAHVDERRRLALPASLFATRTEIGRRIETLLRTRRHVARPGAVAMTLLAIFGAATFAFGADFSRPKAPRAAETPRVPAVPGVAAVAPDAPAVVAPDGPMVATGTAHYDNVSLYETNDERDLQLRAEGIEFERGTGRIVKLDDEGFLRVWEKRGENERRVVVTTHDDGTLRYRYRVDDRPAEWDADGQRWLGRILLRHLTRVRNPYDVVGVPEAPEAPRVWAVGPSEEPAVAPDVDLPGPAPEAPATPAPETPATPEPEQPAPPERR